MKVKNLGDGVIIEMGESAVTPYYEIYGEIVKLEKNKKYYISTGTDQYYMSGGKVLELRNGKGRKLREVNSEDVIWIQPGSKEYKLAISKLKIK